MIDFVDVGLDAVFLGSLCNTAFVDVVELVDVRDKTLCKGRGVFSDRMVPWLVFLEDVKEGIVGEVSMLDIE